MSAGIPEHLEKLSRGVAAWNRWRKANPNITPDLSGADLTTVSKSSKRIVRKSRGTSIGRKRFRTKTSNLSSINLSGAKLRRVNLEAVNLAKADLSNADLTKANFFYADLSKANLTRARLDGADFEEANLRGANLKGAFLHNADFTGANVMWVDFRGADLRKVRFEFADLKGAKLGGANLEKALLWDTDISKANLKIAVAAGAIVRDDGQDDGWDVETEAEMDVDYYESDMRLKREMKHTEVDYPVREKIEVDPPNYAVVQIFFATDRSKLKDATPAKKFGNDRGTLSFGKCKVSIPHDRKKGDLNSPSILRFEFREDPEKHIVLLSIDVHRKKNFFKKLAAKIEASKKKSAFLFIHGYNVSFENAARRTAQMAYDLEFDGAPIFYSWPSKGKPLAYTVDEQNIEWSETNLKNFLKEFFEMSIAEHVFLIAHSMGTRGLSRAIKSLLNEKPEVKERLEEIILAAPDIDATVFKRDIAPVITADQQTVTLYASSGDLALKMSRKFHGNPRAGESGKNLVVAEGVETIDSSEVDTSIFGHSDFVDDRILLTDINTIIEDGKRADDRFGLEPVGSSNNRYWKFKK
jgi:esterase/lipase superfamily enzyme/uncharacterized protein YjbI with pentapeptide repeats